MKSITIHNIDDKTERLIEKQAREKGLSLNQTVKELLRNSLGVEPGGGKGRGASFEDLCGVWTERDAREFEGATDEFERIEENDWS